MLEIIKAGNHGIWLPQLGIGLDYSGSKAEYVFVSHAHADHVPRKSHAKVVYATPATKAFMRLRGTTYEVNSLPFQQSLEIQNARVTFYPAGHILGSALTLIESDEGNLLYTGDYRSPASPATDGFELPKIPIHQFITEATFSLPIYKWPDNEELKSRVVSNAKTALANGFTPIFLAYNLGKAQEIMHLLKDFHHPVQIHKAGFKLCEVYEQSGIDLGNYEAYNTNTCEGKVLICPASAMSKGFASAISKKWLVYCSGWATGDLQRGRFKADALIPLSDHLDFFELIRICEKLRPKMTYITHTPNSKVVQHYLDKQGLPSTDLEAISAKVRS